LLSLVVVGVALQWIVVGLLCWLGYRLFVENGRLLMRVEALEDLADDVRIEGLGTPAAEPEGLSPGTTAPSFELPELGGGRVALEQFRGRRVLLVFFSAHCGYCEQMAPELAAMPLDGRDRLPVPLLIASSSPEAMRDFVAKQGLECSVLLQQNDEVSAAYKAIGTPTGYLIDEEGTLISDLAIGAPKLLELARNPDSPLIKTGSGSIAFLGMPRPPES
jgi:peroxiredoxin